MSLVPVDPRRPGWVELMGPAGELAKSIAETEFVPLRLRKRPAAVMACILSGDEAGIGPMQALRQIFVTDDGKVGMAAELMRSLVLRDGHEIWAEDYTTTKVTMAGRRRGQENPSRVTWSMDDAKKAGLANRQNWTRYPRAMLMARATTELCRLLFADVIAGISYSLEELEDGDEVLNGEVPADTTVAAAGTTKRKAPASRRTRAKTVDPAAPSPEPPPLPGEDPPPPADDAMPIDRKIAMRARAAGIDHHHVVEAVTYGQKKSAKDLTGEEAAQVLDELKGIAEGRRRLITNPGEWPLLEDAEAPVDAELVPEGPPLPDEAEVPGDPAQWDTDAWRAFLAAKGVRVSDVLREGHKLAKEEGINPPTSLGEIRKVPGLAARLHDFVNDLAGA